MHLHILGISGTFMSALAILAKSMGHCVTGSDHHCYPPVSDLLRNSGIDWTVGYEDAELALAADSVIVGNAIKRGMPVMEAVMNARKSYVSGPAWLYEHILSHRRVIAVAGTHGKTTTTSMISRILHDSGLNPGFLIGGVSSDFNTNACLGNGEWFVIEADEYDTAFFDKRPKFMHYRPEIAVLNNLEFDHADIYSNLSDIEQQFHYLLRTIPNSGLIVKPKDDSSLNQVLSKGVFSACEEWSLQAQNETVAWRAELLNPTGSAFEIWYRNEIVARIEWGLIGSFNVENALSAIVACNRAGVHPKQAAIALESFVPVKRRLEVKYSQQNVTIYDDFAHHPTAIKKTVDAVLKSGKHRRLLVALEFGSYTMKMGLHAHALAESLQQVDRVCFLNPTHFSLDSFKQDWTFPYSIHQTTEELVASLTENIHAGDAILVMSNRGFDGIHQQLIERVKMRSNLPA